MEKTSSATPVNLHSKVVGTHLNQDRKHRVSYDVFPATTAVDKAKATVTKVGPRYTYKVPTVMEESSKSAGLEQSLSLYQHIRQYLNDVTAVDGEFDEHKNLTKPFHEYFNEENRRLWRTTNVLMICLLLGFALEIEFVTDSSLVNEERPNVRKNVLLFIGGACLVCVLDIVMHHYVPKLESCAVNIRLATTTAAGILLAGADFFLEHMVIVYSWIYATNFHRKRVVLLCALIVDATKKLCMICRWEFNPPSAANYSNNCKILPSDRISCGQKLLLAFILSAAVHVVGYATRLIYEMKAKTFYLTVRQAQKQQREFEKAIAESEKIALATLPAKVWADFKLHEEVSESYSGLDILFAAKCLVYEYPEVVILYGDIVGFTSLSSRMSPQQLLTVLDRVFSAFDSIVDKYNLEKIKTIGDAYVVCGGIPIKIDGQVGKMVLTAREMIEAITAVNREMGTNLSIRTGIHIGAVKGGIIGQDRLMFDVWSEDVDIAAMMEHYGVAGQVHISNIVLSHIVEHVFVEPHLSFRKNDKILQTYLITDVVGELLTKSQKECCFVEHAAKRSDKSILLKKSYTPQGAEMRRASRSNAYTSVNSLSSNLGLNGKANINRWTLSFMDPDEEIAYWNSIPANRTLYAAACVEAVTLVLLVVPLSVSGNEVLTWTPMLIALCFQSGLIWLLTRISNSSSLPTSVRHRLISRMMLVATTAVLMAALLPRLFSPAISYEVQFFSVSVFSVLMLPAVMITLPISWRTAVVFATLATYVVSVLIKGIPNVHASIFFASFESILVAYIIRKLEVTARKIFATKNELREKQKIVNNLNNKTLNQLHHLLPSDVAAKLRADPEALITDSFEDAAVLFCEIKNIEIKNTPVAQVLHQAYVLFDSSARKFGVEKIKSNGSIYMAFARDASDPKSRMAAFAIELKRIVFTMNVKNATELQLTIGVNYGPIVAGVIGRRKYSYDIWGDTANVASRMMSTCEPNSIQMTSQAAERVAVDFNVQERGVVYVKGKGEILTSYLLNKKADRTSRSLSNAN